MHCSRNTLSQTWTLFGGSTPAVDAWLERHGRLTRLMAADQLGRLAPRSVDPKTPAQLRERGNAIEQAVVQATLAILPERGGRKRILAPT